MRQQFAERLLSGLAWLVPRPDNQRGRLGQGFAESKLAGTESRNPLGVMRRDPAHGAADWSCGDQAG